MSSTRRANYLQSLLGELCALPREAEWVEFKENNFKPDDIGQYISALANAAALVGKTHAYLVWGVRDNDHTLVGTRFKPHEEKVGREELESWLLRLLEPKIDFQFNTIAADELTIVLLEITLAARQPVRFSGQEYIRVGSYKKKLKDFPEKERALWRIFDQTPFEEGIAWQDAGTEEDVLSLLDYPSYFDLLELPLPDNRQGILTALAAERLIRRSDAGHWDITHLGGILFAKRLEDFHTLRRQAVRVVQYSGTRRTETLKEQERARGYAAGFERLVSYINGLLPANEVLGQALRRTIAMFPERAVRELVANALIHQDFSVTGAGPMVEIFTDRIEITNPGEPLVDPQRFIDSPPRSRNESLAGLMRRFGICEERGSGIDKVVLEVELFQLPAPLFERPDGFTRAVLFAHKELKAMEKPDRIRATYQHACLRYLTREAMTNTSLRERFGIVGKNAAVASRLLNEALEAGLIVIADPNAGTRNRQYLPFWATSVPRSPEIV
ncbi:MAG: transcriptional regulator [Gammaproteobacteria bacterium]|nr:transcriptional regulator [Gammaproteobacteria bacterium]